MASTSNQLIDWIVFIWFWWQETGRGRAVSSEGISEQIIDQETDSECLGFEISWKANFVFLDYLLFNFFHEHPFVFH